MDDSGTWQFEPAAFDELLGGVGHNILLGHRYHAHGPGWVELAMPWRETLVGDRASGAFASGPIIALLDNAAGTVIWILRGGILPQVTVDLRIDHIRPSRRGETLIGRCECYRMDRTLGFIRGLAYDASPDDPVCHVTGTFMLLDGPLA